MIEIYTKSYSYVEIALVKAVIKCAAADREIPCPEFATAFTYCKEAVVSTPIDQKREKHSVLQKFQAEIRQSPAVTMLHTFSCAVCGASGDLKRVVRARNISEAVLDLIAIYMCEGVRRNVSACRCTEQRQTRRS
jgi:hypothetical protein